MIYQTVVPYVLSIERHINFRMLPEGVSFHYHLSSELQGIIITLHFLSATYLLAVEEATATSAERKISLPHITLWSVAGGN